MNRGKNPVLPGRKVSQEKRKLRFRLRFLKEPTFFLCQLDYPTIGGIFLAYIRKEAGETERKIIFFESRFHSCVPWVLWL